MRAEPSPPARLLDLSRSVSRIGQLPTGIDRVERAYLDAFLADPAPLFGLVRTAAGFLLLDEAGCRLLAEGLMDVDAREDHQHRLSTDGQPLMYTAFVGRKRGSIPPSLLEAIG